MTEHERRVESLRQQNHRLQKRLAEAEARNAKLGKVIYAAQHYIDALNTGIGPSHPHYLPLRDAYRNAMADLDAAPGDPAGERG